MDPIEKFQFKKNPIYLDNWIIVHNMTTWNERLRENITNTTAMRKWKKMNKFIHLDNFSICGRAFYSLPKSAVTAISPQELAFTAILGNDFCKAIG